MKKLVCLLAFLAGVSLAVPAQERQIEFTEFTLKNGLHVILHEDHSTPIVAVSVLYHVGSKNERPDRTGFAHFFEHLLFYGTENIESGQIDELIKGAGGMLNANTTLDRTFYFEVLPSNQLELALWIESERMLHARIDQTGVEREREIVKEERRQRVDNQPYGTILEETLKRAYHEHPYRWGVIGSMDHLNSAKLEEFVAFYDGYYVPDNAVLSIAGDIDPKTAKKLVKKYFKGIPSAAKEIYRPDAVEPVQTAEIRDVVYDNIQLPAVVMAYKIPAQGTEEYYPVDMVMKLLSQGESSRLNKSVKDEKQKALFTGAFPLQLEDPGIAIMFAITSAGVAPEDLETAIQEEIDKVKDALIDEREFQKLRNQIENELVTNNATMRGISESLANFHTYFGDANLINTTIQRYMKVTREEMKEAAGKYLRNENRVVLYYLPRQEEPAEKAEGSDEETNG